MCRPSATRSIIVAVIVRVRVGDVVRVLRVALVRRVRRNALVETLLPHIDDAVDTLFLQ